MIRFPLFMLIVAATASQQSCQKQIPIWNRDVYRGSSEKKGIVRAQGGQMISCDDPKIDDYYAVKKEDFECLIETYVVNSKGWTKQSACGLQPSKP